MRDECLPFSLRLAISRLTTALNTETLRELFNSFPPKKNCFDIHSSELFMQNVSCIVNIHSLNVRMVFFCKVCDGDHVSTPRITNLLPHFGRACCRYFALLTRPSRLFLQTWSTHCQREHSGFAESKERACEPKFVDANTQPLVLMKHRRLVELGIALN